MWPLLPSSFQIQFQVPQATGMFAVVLRDNHYHVKEYPLLYQVLDVPTSAAAVCSSLVTMSVSKLRQL